MPHVRTALTATARLIPAMPPLAVLALAGTHLGFEIAAAGRATPIVVVQVLAVIAQAAVLTARHRTPVTALSSVVALDLVIVATSGGETTTGALAVVFAVYAIVREARGSATTVALTIAVTASLGVGIVAGLVGGAFDTVVLIAVVAARLALQYALPAAVAASVAGRERLVDALRERAELAERERRAHAVEQVRAERAAMARELHDIAAHHLSGIIVSAQAAATLLRTDADRAADLLVTVQREAQTTMADLRRTVGLLRSTDDTAPSDSASSPATVPSVASIHDLVSAASARRQRVTLVVDGDPRPLGPLAETAAYRMVQESLSNTARHAPGAAVQVHVDFDHDRTLISVTNDATTQSDTAGVHPQTLRGPGFGLAGMEERADLVGARLRTGATADGGWRNELWIPTDRRPA